MNVRDRAPYATDPADSLGRRFDEPASPTRTAFQRDRDRILHSTAFRRLARKAQVFVDHEGDHFRTRLTHTIEVAQIARALAKGLALDEDLAEAVALGHDLGHAPFGHTGEDALNACMAEYGGFDHNSQALRIVTALERRYAAFDGLNLSYETIEGLVKHNGPLMDREGRPLARYREQGIPAEILAYDGIECLELSQFASLEAQAAAIADDIAYNAHDIDDGLRAGLFDLTDLRGVAFIESLLDEIEKLHPGLERPRVIHELVRRVITRFIEDVLDESRRLIAANGAGRLAQVRLAKRQLVGFSPEMAVADARIKGFLFANMYRHPEVKRVRDSADLVVRRLFSAFMQDPGLMPVEWRGATEAADARIRARAISDYIAGMTDRYALTEHRRLFDGAPDLR
jgi:dGTPase